MSHVVKDYNGRVAVSIFSVYIPQVGNDPQMKERPGKSVFSKKTEHFIYTVRPEKSG